MASGPAYWMAWEAFTPGREAESRRAMATERRLSFMKIRELVALLMKLDQDSVVLKLSAHDFRMEVASLSFGIFRYVPLDEKIGAWTGCRTGKAVVIG